MHRIAYTLLVGPIAAGMQLHHRCENKRCYNPDHLEAVLPSEHPMNRTAFLRKAEKRAAKTHCKHGHEFSPENTIWTGERNKRKCRVCERRRGARNRRRRAEASC